MWSACVGGTGGLGGRGWQTGAFQRAESILTPGLREGRWGGTCRWEVCNFHNTVPPPCRNLPPFPKEDKAPDPPSPLLSCPQNPPSPEYPPFPTSPHPLNKICEKKNNHLFWGSLESKLDMFRSIEDQVSSGRVTVNCGRSTKANGGALGSQDRKDGMLHLQSRKS